MTTSAKYRNHGHYIKEGWSREPKESFKAAWNIISSSVDKDVAKVLDVGCATGEFIGFLSKCIPDARFVGVDVTEDLLDEGRRLLPQAEFVNASALALPSELKDFDIVCAIGCMSIFDETQIEAFWDNLLGAVRPGGLVLVLSPLNEFGVDAMIRHRKRPDGVAGDWESGWNIFSQETIREILQARGVELVLERFELPIDLPPSADPIRTWTMATANRERQLTNGLKLLVDHYFMVCKVKD